MRRSALRELGCLVAAVLLCSACGLGGDRAASQAQKLFSDSQDVELAIAVAGWGDPARIHELVAAGANPNAAGIDGDVQYSMLLWAQLKRSPGGYKALLEAGADPTLGDESGNTAVHLAAMDEKETWLEILFEHGVSPDTPNTRTGESPLVAALMSERSRNIDILLDAGADPDMADRQGETAVHAAAAINQWDAVLQFLEEGADPRVRDTGGRTFQGYLFVTPDTVLDAIGRRDRNRVIEWLEGHNIPIENSEAP